MYIWRKGDIDMAGKFRADCYKKVCEMCVLKGNKKLLGGYTCIKGHAPSQNACFYFSCQGKGTAKCEKCQDLVMNKRNGFR